MVLCGIDRVEKYSRLFENKRLGLLTSASGVTADMRSSIELFHSHYKLTALFGPEHGVRGDRDAGETVEQYVDDATGLIVYSLYRADSKRLTEEMLSHVDTVVYDIQDVGTRYYTFISTMLYALEDCAKYGKELIILDRPDPLDGVTVEGGVLKDEFKSFVGCYSLPVRYGLTVGELAKMMNKEQNIGCNLTVVECENYRRDMLYPETGRLWMMPSLGIPRFDTALFYPGLCLLEGTNISEGRGTSCPFEIIGADFIVSADLVSEMNSRKLPGVLFTPAYFTPTSSKQNGKRCGGIHFHLTNPHEYQSVRSGIELIDALNKLYGDKLEILPPPKENGRHFITLLSGNDYLLDRGFDKDKILGEYEKESAEFKERAKEFYIY